MKVQINYREAIKRLIKYLLEGMAVAIAARYIPQNKMQLREVIMIAITAACVFAILDMYSPTVSTAARQGSGLMIGANLIKNPIAALL